MTYVFLFRTFSVNPGYLPSWLKVPVTSEGLSPMNVVRIYNMRTWMANGVYKFEQFATNDDIEISLASTRDSDKDEISSDFATKSCDEIPSLTTPSTVVDVKKLTPMEQRVYDLSEEEWTKIEEEVLAKFSGEVWSLINWRYCMKCKSVRPPRSHHCSMCSRCILRMDHHCPWVGNCVGMYNHKYFLMFLFHAMTGCAIASLVMIHNAFHINIREFNKNPHYLAVMIVAGALIFSLGGLLGFHSYLIATN